MQFKSFPAEIERQNNCDDDDDPDADKDGNGNTAKNTVISPNFLVCKFCGKAQFPHSFGRIARNYAETVPFHKISIPEN